MGLRQLAQGYNYTVGNEQDLDGRIPTFQTFLCAAIEHDPHFLLSSFAKVPFKLFYKDFASGTKPSAGKGLNTTPKKKPPKNNLIKRTPKNNQQTYKTQTTRDNSLFLPCWLVSLAVTSFVSFQNPPRQLVPPFVRSPHS